MFKFLKDKLKSAVSKFTKGVSKEVGEEAIKSTVEEPSEKVKESAGKIKEHAEEIKDEVREDAGRGKKEQKKKSKLKDNADLSEEDVERVLDENIKENIEKSDDEIVKDEKYAEILEDIDKNVKENFVGEIGEIGEIGETGEIGEIGETGEIGEIEEIEEIEEKVSEKKKGFFGRIKEKFSKKAESEDEQKFDEEIVKIEEKEKEHKEKGHKEKHKKNIEEEDIEGFEYPSDISQNPHESTLNMSKNRGYSKSSIEKASEFKPIEEKEEFGDEHEKAVFEDMKKIEEELEEEDKKDKVIKTEKGKQAKTENPIEEEKKGFFGRLKESITHKTLSDEKFNDLFWELELTLLESNVALDVIEKIKSDLKKELVDSKISRLGVDRVVANTLKKSIEDLFDIEKVDLIEKINEKIKMSKNGSGKEPFVISFVGINGAGKTTTLAKIANYLQKNGFSIVFAAADTFRAASMEQLQFHADKLGIKMIKHDYGSDPAAVAFDAIAHAKSKGIDVVMIDTAGRTNMDSNLMEELRKIIKVAKPDLNIFIGDAVTGNDAVEQAQKFNEYVGIDGIVLAKADVDEKGGCSVSISFVTKKPILFIGVGQAYDDLKEFDSSIILENLGLA